MRLLSPDFPVFHLQSKITKAIMTHISHLLFHQRQALSLQFILTDYFVLKLVNPSTFDFAIQGEFSHNYCIYFVNLKKSYPKEPLVFIITFILSVICKQQNMLTYISKLYILSLPLKHIDWFIDLVFLPNLCKCGLAINVALLYFTMCVIRISISINRYHYIA